jgi:hypothetical protein
MRAEATARHREASVGDRCRATNGHVAPAAPVDRAQKHFSKKFRAALYTRGEVAIHLSHKSGPAMPAEHVNRGGFQREPPD